MTSGGAIARAPRPSSLADVLDLILDKGLVIDAYVRISAVGIELLTIDARIVIASVDTYLHYAEAVNRLDITQTEIKGLTGFFDQGSQSSDGGSSNGNSQGGSSKSSRPPRGRSSERPALSRSSRSSGNDDENREGDGEGKAKGVARRLGEKGRWNS